MQRIDQKRTHVSHWESNYGGWQTERADTSTTELSGSVREADLIVRGLKALKAHLLLSEAAGVTSKYHADIHGSTMRPVNGAPTLGEVESLLASIEQPNFVGEPIVEEA